MRYACEGKSEYVTESRLPPSPVTAGISKSGQRNSAQNAAHEDGAQVQILFPAYMTLHRQHDGEIISFDDYERQTYFEKEDKQIHQDEIDYIFDATTVAK